MMKLTREHILERLRVIKPVLQQQYHLTELALFGSFARNEQTEKSDIDILVNYSPKNYKDFVYSTDSIESLFPGYIVQFATRDSIKPQYFEAIKPDLIYA